MKVVVVMMIEVGKLEEIVVELEEKVEGKEMVRAQSRIKGQRVRWSRGGSLGRETRWRA